MSRPSSAAPVIRKPREWPKLCADSVVRNILSGAQTQDRRPLKPQPRGFGDYGTWWPRKPDARGNPKRAMHYASEDHFRKGWALDFGPAIGDAHWIRECWARHPLRKGEVLYRATEREWTPERWRPSIHMPRWACRLVLPITRVWVERIQEISTGDARAEGAIEAAVAAGMARKTAEQAPVWAFRRYIWEPLYPGSWERNDWVLCTAWDKPEVRR